jgi:hypothetical protein
VFENSVLGRLFASVRGKIIEGWRKLYDEEVHNLYTSPNTVRMIGSKEYRIDEACSTHGE